jgi:hypothetical protein
VIGQGQDPLAQIASLMQLIQQMHERAERQEALQRQQQMEEEERALRREEFALRRQAMEHEQREAEQAARPLREVVPNLPPQVLERYGDLPYAVVRSFLPSLITSQGQQAEAQQKEAAQARLNAAIEAWQRGARTPEVEQEYRQAYRALYGADPPEVTVEGQKVPMALYTPPAQLVTVGAYVQQANPALFQRLQDNPRAQVLFSAPLPSDAASWRHYIDKLADIAAGKPMDRGELQLTLRGAVLHYLQSGDRRVLTTVVEELLRSGAVQSPAQAQALLSQAYEDVKRERTVPVSLPGGAVVHVSGEAAARILQNERRLAFDVQRWAAQPERDRERLLTRQEIDARRRMERAQAVINELSQRVHGLRAQVVGELKQGFPNISQAELEARADQILRKRLGQDYVRYQNAVVAYRAAQAELDLVGSLRREWAPEREPQPAPEAPRGQLQRVPSGDRVRAAVDYLRGLPREQQVRELRETMANIPRSELQQIMQALGIRPEELGAPPARPAPPPRQPSAPRPQQTGPLEAPRPQRPLSEETRQALQALFPEPVTARVGRAVGQAAGAVAQAAGGAGRAVGEAVSRWFQEATVPPDLRNVLIRSGGPAPLARFLRVWTTLSPEAKREMARTLGLSAATVEWIERRIPGGR